MDEVPARPDGVFVTSWRAFVREQASVTVFVAAILAALFWWMEGAAALRFVGGFVALYVAWETARFVLLGVAEVRIDPDALATRARTGRQQVIRRADLTSAHLEKRWVMRTADQTLRVRDLGFASDDWQALSAAVTAWKVQPGQPQPGVTLVRGGRQFQVARPWLPLAVGVGLLAVGLGATWLARADYADGGWTEAPLVTVGIPLFCVAVGAYQLRLATRTVTAARFGPDALVASRLIGDPVLMPYAEIRDAYGPWTDAASGTLYWGQRNLDVLAALLAERLPDGQISGLRWLRQAAWLQWPFLLAAAVGAGAVWWGTTAWVRGSPKMDEFAGMLALVAYAGLLVAGVRVWASRLLREIDGAPPP